LPFAFVLFFLGFLMGGETGGFAGLAGEFFAFEGFFAFTV
jgi:hypothetical protein